MEFFELNSKSYITVTYLEINETLNAWSKSEVEHLPCGWQCKVLKLFWDCLKKTKGDYVFHLERNKLESIFPGLTVQILADKEESYNSCKSGWIDTYLNSFCNKF